MTIIYLTIVRVIDSLSPVLHRQALQSCTAKPNCPYPEFEPGNPLEIK